MNVELFFAWVDYTEDTFGVQHHVKDEDVFAFTISQKEGEFAAARVTLRNPRIGFLSPSRKTWAWLSMDLHDGNGVQPLLFGRLVGVPANMFQELVEVEFLARPFDFDTKKRELADTLRTLPQYDPIWVSPDRRADPDVVLEARSALWHIDRVTHEVSISDLLDGEDGLISFSEDEVFYDSVSISLEQVPARKVHVAANIGWNQRANGTVPIIGPASSFNGFQYLRAFSYTGQGLIDAWPVVGQSINGGYIVTQSVALDVGNAALTLPTLTMADIAKDEAALSFYRTFGRPITMRENFQPGGAPIEERDDYQYITLQWEFMGVKLSRGFNIPIWQVNLALKLDYAADRQRFETVNFTLQSDVQSVVTLPGEDEIITIEISSSNVDEPLDPNDPDSAPIGDVRRSDYLPTDRGIQSLEYLIHLARAQLILASRVVRIGCDIPFQRCLELSLRKSASVADRRIPGGVVLGKIIEYTITLDGETGVPTANMIIGSAVGNNNYVVAATGEPDYVDEDYVEDDYQVFIDGENLIGAGDVAYARPVASVVDDGVNFIGGVSVGDIAQVQIINQKDVQKQKLIEAIAMIEYPDDTPEGEFTVEYTNYEKRNQIQVDVARRVLEENPTQVVFTLKDLTAGPYTANYDIAVSDLMIPAMIDLEAESTP